MRTRLHGTSTRGATARRGDSVARRAQHRLGFAAVIGVMVGGLVACQDGMGGTIATAPAWTEVEIAAVFDLSELGRLSMAPSGDHLVLAGRPLPAAVIERFPHLTIGRTTNVLAFDDDALAAMSADARRVVEHATPGELRAVMRTHGLTMHDVHDAWTTRGRIGLDDLLDVAARLDARSGPAAARSGVGPGGRLLDALGVAR